MNNRDKMYIANSHAREWLKANGYTDLHFFPHTRFSKDVHFQGLSFDGCASFLKTFVLFQVKTNLKPTKKQTEQMHQIMLFSFVEVLWFNKVDGTGVIEVYK
jgi:hypothetical protein